MNCVQCEYGGAPSGGGGRVKLAFSVENSTRQTT